MDEADHCETSVSCYEDLCGLLDAFCDYFGKSRATLSIYDPYYCNGGVIERLASLGFHNVYNRLEDFYERIEKSSLPDYDVLVTNPPYSASHMQRLVEYAQTSTKPFCLLMPNFVYTKDWFSKTLTGSSLSCLGKVEMAYILRPSLRYEYLPPSWVRADTGSTAVRKSKQTTAPFFSFWYVGGFSKHILSRVDTRLSGLYVAKERHKEMFNHQLLLCLGSDCLPMEVRGELDHSRKRPNAKTRKRMKQRLQNNKQMAK